MAIIKVNGTRMRLMAKDIDGDGVTGGVERLQRSHAEQNIVQPTELGESLVQLNDDVIDSDTRMSGIDLRSRLNSFEMPSILAIDTLVALKVLPTSCLAFTRQKKRLSVSINGEGRKEIVQIVGGKKEQDAAAGNGGMFDKIKSGLGMG